MSSEQINTSSGKESSLFLSLYPKGYTPYRIKKFDILIAFALFLIAAIGYIRTLTPSVGAGDNGELTTTLYNMGACHPPGYPLWAIMGKLFTFIPVGDIAYRVNLYVALSAAGTIFFLYLILVKLLGLNRDKGSLSLPVHIPAIGASMAFAFSLTLWGQAIGGEVYPLNALLVSFMIFIMVLWYEEMIVFRSEGRLHFAERMTLLLAFSMGLSLTNHQLPMWYIVAYGIVLLPMTIFIVVSERSQQFAKEFKERAAFFFVFVVVMVAAMVIFMKYGYLNRLLFPKDVPYVVTAILLIPGYLTVYTIGVKLMKRHANLADNWVDRFFEIFMYSFWLLLFAMSVYLYLVVRAKALAPLPDPKPLSWGDTQTLDILFNHMMRKQYGIGGGSDINNLLGQFWEVFKFNVKQFHWINIVIAGAGIVAFFLKDKIWLAFTVIAILIFDLALIKFVNFDLDLRTLSFQEVMYIQTFMFVALYIGFGYQLLMDAGSRLVKLLAARKKSG